MIDFSPFVADLLGVVQTVVVGIVGVLATYATRWILRKTHLDGLIQEDLIRNYLYTALENAVIFGVDQVKKDLGDKAIVDVKNDILAAAIEYVMKTVPDALAHFGLDSPEKIRDLLLVRLNKYLDSLVPAPVPAVTAEVA